MINNENDNYEIIDIKNQAKYKVWQETSDTKRYSSDLRNPYNNIDFSNFEAQNYGKVFQRTISPQVKQNKKSGLGKIIGILAIVYFIMWLILLAVLFMIDLFGPSEIHYSLQEDTSVFAPFIGLFALVFFILSLFFLFLLPKFFLGFLIQKATPKISDALYKSLSKPTLADLKKKFFNALKIEYYPINTVLSQVDNISELMTKINSDYKKFVRADDFISFSYKNLPISIVEFRSVGLEASSCIFIATKINKNITRETFVKAKDSSIQSVSFSDNFLVQSFNPAEARTLLTPAFRARLLKYRKEHNNCQIDILFSNKVSDKENIFICIPSQKNYFEMSEQDWKDESKSYQIISEIREILLIVDALKLDQDIGI